GCIRHPDDLLCRERIIHLRRRRVHERAYGGAKQDLRASASAAAALETQSVQEARVAEAGAATPQAKYRVNGLAGRITRELPVDGAILPESRRATCVRRRQALDRGGAFG